MMLPEEQFRHQSVAIVGSAPGCRLVEADVYAAINGSVGILRESSLEPGVLFTTSYLARVQSRQHAYMLSTWEGLHFPSVWVDTQDGPADPVRQRFEELSATAGTWTMVAPGLRGDIVKAATGHPLGSDPDPMRRVSSGVFAACVALLSGAASVTLCGMSFESGHWGMEWDTQARHHVPADTDALGALLSRYGRKIRTTSGKLSLDLGMERAG